MDILAHFRTLLREVDSSLLDEWEALTQPGAARGRAQARRAAGASIRWPSARALHAAHPRRAAPAGARAGAPRLRGGGAPAARRATASAWTAERLDRGDGAVLGRARRAADHARRAPPRSHAHRRARAGPLPRPADAGRRGRATRTGRSTASSTCTPAGADAPAARAAADRDLKAAPAATRRQRSTVIGRARRAGRRARRRSPRRRRAGRR